VASLVKSGCLAAIQGPAVTGQLEWRFEVHEVEQLLSRMLKCIAKDEKDTGPRVVGFHKTIQKLSKLSIEVGEFVALILQGEVTPIAKGEGTGLASLLFDSGKVEAFSRAMAAQRRGSTRTLSEAARIIRAGNTDMPFLIKRGLLIPEKLCEGRGGSWGIAQEEIDRFKATYGTVGQIISAFGTSPKGVAKRLMANGIMPISGPQINGGSTYFFKKADLEAVDLAAILPKANNSTLEKMNDKGLVSKRQLADISGYPLDRVTWAIERGLIVPALMLHRKDGKGSRPFFSHDQIEMAKELREEELRQLALFGAAKSERRLAA